MSFKRAIESELGVRVGLRMGGPGALDVYVDGEQVYSKRKTGRMPTADELVALIRPKVAASTKP